MERSLTSEEILDGEEHALRPGVDFGPAAGKVVDWVEAAIQPDLVPGESPVMKWVNVDPVGNDVSKFWSITEGWAVAASNLSKIAEVLGEPVECAQENYRDKQGEILRTEWVVRPVLEDEEEEE